MTRDLVDTAGYYQLSHSNGRLADGCRLRFDRGTLLLEGMNRLPPGLEEDFRHDPRVDAYRAPAYRYPRLIGKLLQAIEEICQ